MLKKNFKWVFGTLIMLFSLLTIGIILGNYARTSQKENFNGQFDTKPCRFEDFAGVLTVEEIRSNPSEKTGKDMLIIYQFDPGVVTDLPYIKKDSGQIETTSAEIKRLGIKPGKQFQTKAEYILSGFCSPGPHVKDLNTWKLIGS